MRLNQTLRNQRQNFQHQSFKGVSDTNNDTVQKQILQTKKKEIIANIKEYNFDIKNIRDWDFDVLHEFVTSPILTKISSRTPISAQYTNIGRKIDNSAKIEMKMGAKKYVVQTSGDNKSEADHMLRLKLRDINESSESNFISRVNEHNNTVAKYNKRQSEIVEKLNIQNKENMIEIKNQKQMSRYLLVSLSTSEVLKDIAKANNGISIIYNTNNKNSASIDIEFDNKQYKIKGQGNNTEEAESLICNKLATIESNGSEEFLKLVQEKPTESQFSSFFGRLFKK